jgi:hypothetical protein
MADKHTEDLRNVREGDTVVITPTDGGAFTCECTDAQVVTRRQYHRCRETKIWEFTNVDVKIYASILDGLSFVADDTDLPQHSEMYDASLDQNIGYIEKLTIRGQMEA